jgi:hypothetical protein
MMNSYRMSEDEFNKLQRAQESIQLLVSLFDVVRGPHCVTPQQIASFMALLGEDIGGVLQAVGKTYSTR